jgi:decaprenylphospho-beta-D-ribofuranose 2-oxidase
VVRPALAAPVVRELVLGADGRGVLARGLGRSYGDAAQNAGGTVLDMTALDGIRDVDLEHGTVTAEAGVSLDTLMRRLLPHGWFVPVSPGTRHVTVGGAIAADIHGKNHHRDGSFCDHVASLVLCTPDGELRTLTREETPDEFLATAGGMGLTGVVVQATIQMTPVTSTWMAVDTERARDLDDALDRMERRDDEYRYSVAWIDCSAPGARLGRSVLTRGDHARREDRPPAPRPGAPRLGSSDSALRFDPRTRWRVPPAVPGGLLRPATVGAFNELYFRRAPRERRGELQPLASFFHPLDGVRNWNRLYGPRGFVQYQMVVPPRRHDVVKTTLEWLREAHHSSFLAVLKRMGTQHGMLSFPTEGWTLAVDVPSGSPRLAQTLDAIDLMVAEAGGRVYLAKDSRLRPEIFREMYGEGLERWLQVRRRLDPEGRMTSDLARRLELAAPAWEVST